MRSLSTLAAGLIALVAASSSALATSARTFVSGNGTDTGACTTTDPCRTFAFALTQTEVSGEIIVLSSAGYGTVTINKAVSIINTSNFAGVTVASGNGITINAGTNDSVTLRGLTIDGGDVGANGIVFNSGAKLTIDKCDLMNFVGSGTTGNGIIIQPTTGSHQIVITNTTASNNGYTGVYYYSPGSSTATAGIVVDRLSANYNGYGMAVNNAGAGALTASISNSTANFNTADGFSFFIVTVSLDASYASGNLANGVEMVQGTLALGRSVLMNNAEYGLNNGNNVNSYKDNRIAGNGTGQVATPLPAATLY